MQFPFRIIMTQRESDNGHTGGPSPMRTDRRLRVSGGLVEIVAPSLGSAFPATRYIAESKVDLAYGSRFYRPYHSAQERATTERPLSEFPSLNEVAVSQSGAVR